MTLPATIAICAITVIAITALVSFLATELGEDWSDPHNQPEV